MQRFSRWNLFWTFLRIGFFTVGGGYAMLPLVQQDIVEKNGWVKKEEFLDVLAVSQSVPGPIAVNAATIIGYRLGGISAAIPSLAGVVLPSFIVISILVTFLYRFQNIPLVQASFRGIRPAVVGLISAAVLKLGGSVLKQWKGVVFFISFLALSLVINLHPIAVIILGGISGLLFYRAEAELENLENEKEVME